MHSIYGKTITLTRGDTLRTIVGIKGYTPCEDDEIRFAMAADYDCTNVLVEKCIPWDTMELVLNPEDTKSFPYGKYVYDIQITLSDGTVDTFISKGIIKLTEEVE